MDIILTSSIALELKWRACRSAEQKNYDSALANSKLKKLKKKQCNVLMRPMAATSDVHLQSLNRIELTFAAPFPGGMAKIMPVFGLEIDFDITPVFNAVINYGRQSYLKVRKNKCMMCWVGHPRGTVAFCDKKNYVTDWTEQDDVCIKVNEDETVPPAPEMVYHNGQMRQVKVKGARRIPTIYQPGVTKGIVGTGNSLVGSMLGKNLVGSMASGTKNVASGAKNMASGAKNMGKKMFGGRFKSGRKLLRVNAVAEPAPKVVGVSDAIGKTTENVVNAGKKVLNGNEGDGIVGNTNIKTTMANCHNPLKAYGRSGNGDLNNIPESRLMETEQKPVLIDAEQFCAAMTYQMVNADKPPRYMLKPMKKSGGGGANSAGGFNKKKRDKTRPKGTTVGSTDTNDKKKAQDGHEGHAMFIDIDELGDLGKNIPFVHGQMHLGGVPLQR